MSRKNYKTTKKVHKKFDDSHPVWELKKHLRKECGAVKAILGGGKPLKIDKKPRKDT